MSDNAHWRRFYAAKAARIENENKRLTRERDDARRWAVRLEQEMFNERQAAYRLLKEALSVKPLFSR